LTPSTTLFRSFLRLLMASRINPSDEMNSLNIKSAPFSLHKRRKGGSLTSSIGASNNGNSGSSMFPMRIMAQKYDFRAFRPLVLKRGFSVVLKIQWFAAHRVKNNRRQNIVRFKANGRRNA